jgi:predicted metal-dependent enzyme (double-stranded beta helix superfamily)
MTTNISKENPVIAEELLSAREYAQRLIGALDQPRDSAAFRDALRDAMEKFLGRPDLLVLGVERTANHQPWSSYLYYDGELTVAMSQIGQHRPVPIHDHGMVWESVAVYRGSVNHRMYRSLTEDSRGRSELELVEDAVLGIGEFRALAPPADIHGLHALEDDTYILGAHLGHFSPNRRYYQVGRNTYLLRNQTQWRQSPS